MASIKKSRSAGISAKTTNKLSKKEDKMVAKKAGSPTDSTSQNAQQDGHVILDASELERMRADILRLKSNASQELASQSTKDDDIGKVNYSGNSENRRQTIKGTKDNKTGIGFAAAAMANRHGASNYRSDSKVDNAAGAGIDGKTINKDDDNSLTTKKAPSAATLVKSRSSFSAKKSVAPTETRYNATAESKLPVSDHDQALDQKNDIARGFNEDEGGNYDYGLIADNQKKIVNSGKYDRTDGSDIARAAANIKRKTGDLRGNKGSDIKISYLKADGSEPSSPQGRRSPREKPIVAGVSASQTHNKPNKSNKKDGVNNNAEGIRPPPKEPPSRFGWLAALVLIALIVAGAVFWLRDQGQMLGWGGDTSDSDKVAVVSPDDSPAKVKPSDRQDDIDRTASADKGDSAGTSDPIKKTVYNKVTTPTKGGNEDADKVDNLVPREEFAPAISTDAMPGSDGQKTDGANSITPTKVDAVIIDANGNIVSSLGNKTSDDKGQAKTKQDYSVNNANGQKDVKSADADAKNKGTAINGDKVSAGEKAKPKNTPTRKNVKPVSRPKKTATRTSDSGSAANREWRSYTAFRSTKEAAKSFYLSLNLRRNIKTAGSAFIEYSRVKGATRYRVVIRATSKKTALEVCKLVRTKGEYCRVSAAK